MISSSQVQNALRNYQNAHTVTKVKSTTSTQMGSDSASQFHKSTTEDRKKKFADILKEKMEG